MIKMTDERRQFIDNALANRIPCILATVSKDGQPNTSYRGGVMVFDDEHLAYWDRSKRQSIHDLQENPKVCIRQGAAIIVQVNKILLASGEVVQER